MLTSIATIAGAITALIGVYYSVRLSIKNKELQNWKDEQRSLTQQITEAKTDEERAKLAKLLTDHQSK